jgi:hypothetical protein
MNKALTFNIERHNQIIEQIEKHPETWKQNDWHCGTAHCYAGWAQVFSGKEIDDNTVVRDAREWLGLTKYEADTAFYSGNTLEFLKELPELFTYDKDGRDRYGRDRNGQDKEGYDRNGRDRYGRDRYGRDYFGRDREGFYRNGYNKYGLDKYNNRKP